MGNRLNRAIRWVGRPGNLRYVVAGLVALALFGYVVDIASHGDLLGDLGAVLVRIGPLALVVALPFFALRALTRWAFGHRCARRSPRSALAS